MNTTATTTRKFETEVCGRCCGTGTYSYNMIHGDMCYGCSGKKIRRTKRGQAAYQFYIDLCTKKVEEVVVGECISALGKVCKVIAITRDFQEGASLVDGVMVPYRLEVVEFDFGFGSSTCFLGSEVVTYPNGEEKISKLNAAYDYQETLNDKGKQLKRKIKK